MTIELPTTGWWTVGEATHRPDSVNYEWVTAQGEVLQVSDMKTEHVKNCIIYLEDRMDNYGDDTVSGLTCTDWIDIFLQELERRRYTRSQTYIDAARRRKESLTTLSSRVKRRGTVHIADRDVFEIKAVICPTCRRNTILMPDCEECEGLGSVNRKVKKV